MKRRIVLAGIAATLAPMPLAAQAQQRGGMRRVGVLMGDEANDPVGQADAAALVKGLGALDWHEGNNIRIAWRWAGSDPALHEGYASQLLALGPELVVAAGSTSVEALRRQMGTIPIVFANVGDPVGQGFVESLAHPGGTITGFSNYDPPFTTKSLQMLTQITPPVARVAVLYNPATQPTAGLMLRAVEAAAPTLNVTVRSAPVDDDVEIEAVMAGLGREERGGLMFIGSAFTVAHRAAIIAAAAQHRLPAVYPHRFYAADGGLMSYGIDEPDLLRRAASYVDRILNGAKPADLPVQRPDKFETVFNLKTAQAIHITIPPSLLLLADEVIE